MEKKIVLLGGSGIHDSPSFEDCEWKSIDTGYAGEKGVVSYQQRDDGVIFIPRHGHRVRYGPHDTPYVQNLVAAKLLGAKAVIATSAVGSLSDLIDVGSVVVPHDYIDETGRNDNVYSMGIVVHANPRPAFSTYLRGKLIQSATDAQEVAKWTIHEKGVYVTIPGDRFGTTAEGAVRKQYADIVGMTCCPEASIALQLGLHYALAAFPVDKDNDANHEGGTLEVMKMMSRPHKVPALLEMTIEATDTSTLESPTQLRGNIIPGDTSRISNPHLRSIADGLINTYCGE